VERQLIEIKRINQKDANRICKRWHYSKKAPPISHHFCVFEENIIIGCVSIGYGACSTLGQREGFKNKRVCELNRVAFSGKQKKNTSYYVAAMLSSFKENNKNLDVIFAFADIAQNHVGILYQSMSWVYLGKRGGSGYDFFFNGRKIHSRSLEKKSDRDKCKKEKKSHKHLYAFPFSKSARKKLLKLRKEYPKNARG